LKYHFQPVGWSVGPPRAIASCSKVDVPPPVHLHQVQRPLVSRFAVGADRHQRRRGPRRAVVVARCRLDEIGRRNREADRPPAAGELAGESLLDRGEEGEARFEDAAEPRRRSR